MHSICEDTLFIGMKSIRDCSVLCFVIARTAGVKIQNLLSKRSWMYIRPKKKTCLPELRRMPDLVCIYVRTKHVDRGIRKEVETGIHVRQME